MLSLLDKCIFLPYIADRYNISIQKQDIKAPSVRPTSFHADQMYSLRTILYIISCNFTIRNVLFCKHLPIFGAIGFLSQLSFHWLDRPDRFDGLDGLGVFDRLRGLDLFQRLHFLERFHLLESLHLFSRLHLPHRHHPHPWLSPWQLR